MRELKLKVDQYGTPEGIAANIGYALSLGLPELNPSICVHDGTWVVVGSGPSVRDHIEEIREDSKTRPICAVKGAYDFLRENGITPAFYLSVEPRVRPIQNPHKDTQYLLASRCDPEMFKALKDYRIILWNAWGNPDENQMYEGHISYGGGTTSGLRAVSIGYVLGFRRFRLFGFDSCLVGNEKRINQGEVHNDLATLPVTVGDKTFITTYAMAQQADDFQSLYEFMPGITIKSFGNGLISAIIDQRAKEGMRV